MAIATANIISRFDKQVWGLFGAAVIGVMGSSLVMTFISIYMKETLGMPMTLVGIAVCVTAIGGAVAAYAGGAACDVYGRKKVLIAGLILQILSYLLISLSIDARVAIPLFVLALAFNSFNGGLYRAIPDVMVADVVAPGRRVEAYGLLRIGSNIGWVIGPVLGGIFLMFTSYANLFYVTALTTFAYLLIAVFFLRDTRPKAAPEKLRLRDIATIAADRPFLMFCGLMLFMTIPYEQMYTLFSVYSSVYIGLNDFWVGALYAISGLMVALFQYYLSTKVVRHRMTAALAFSAFVFAAGFGMLALSTAFFMPFIAMAVNTFAEMVWSPASSTLQASMSPEKMRGRYFGFCSLMGSMGWAIGPLFGGFLMDHIGDLLGAIGSATGPLFGGFPAGHMDNPVPLMWAVVSALFIVCMAGFLGLGRVIPKKTDVGKGSEKLEKIEVEAVP